MKSGTADVLTKGIPSSDVNKSKVLIYFSSWVYFPVPERNFSVKFRKILGEFFDLILTSSLEILIIFSVITNHPPVLCVWARINLHTMTDFFLLDLVYYIFSDCYFLSSNFYPVLVLWISADEVTPTKKKKSKKDKKDKKKDKSKSKKRKREKGSGVSLKTLALHPAYMCLALAVLYTKLCSIELVLCGTCDGFCEFVLKCELCMGNNS